MELTQSYIYIGTSFIMGFAVAITICVWQWIKIRRNQKSLEGFLESEKLIKERFQKENKWLYDVKESTQNEYEQKIHELESLVKTMDEDIILLQRHNEHTENQLRETEALLKAKDPVVHTLKLKLLEANNTIARYKGKVPVQ
ncbi:MAG: hypothetical protein JST81_00195 [Bacteroidetes bacterium]|nr:hypothetical protein [Bacteroidota bacterium]